MFVYVCETESVCVFSLLGCRVHANVGWSWSSGSGWRWQSRVHIVWASKQPHRWEERIGTERERESREEGHHPPDFCLLHFRSAFRWSSSQHEASFCEYWFPYRLQLHSLICLLWMDRVDQMLDARLHSFGYYISYGPDLVYMLVERRNVLALHRVF